MRPERSASAGEQHPLRAMAKMAAVLAVVCFAFNPPSTLTSVLASAGKIVAFSAYTVGFGLLADRSRQRFLSIFVPFCGVFTICALSYLWIDFHRHIHSPSSERSEWLMWVTTVGGIALSLALALAATHGWMRYFQGKEIKHYRRR